MSLVILVNDIVPAKVHLSVPHIMWGIRKDCQSVYYSSTWIILYTIIGFPVCMYWLSISPCRSQKSREMGGLGTPNIPLLADFSKKMARDFGVLDEEEGIALR